ncbi:uncharacterized protein LOC142179323 [Nicotiana tabacum]|uniref:Uncharacterized protein LOC142179323 n=1 Tax=Nicotiana tabacum TaxID=4097 RepID=A0AC58U6N1_TOBAC
MKNNVLLVTAMQIIGKSAKELKQGLVETSIVDDDRSYPSELDDILYKRFMFKVIVKPSNIEKKDQVVTSRIFFVVTYEDVKTHKQGGNNSVFLNITLEDDQKNRIATTLWSELMDQIQPHLNEAIDEPLIIVLQFMKPQKFQGNYSMHSYWYSTRLSINSTLPQYVEFKSRLVATCQANCERITQTCSQQSYSIIDELAKGIECTYWIAAKVVNLELQREWSYLACNKCTKKVEKIGNHFFVRNAMKKNVLLVTAMQIIGKSAKELKQGLVETSIVDDDRSYPSELDDILYKRFMFKVIVKSSNIEKKDQVVMSRIFFVR